MKRYRRADDVTAGIKKTVRLTDLIEIQETVTAAKKEPMTDTLKMVLAAEAIPLILKSPLKEKVTETQ
jgi:hypothetical protein